MTSTTYAQSKGPMGDLFKSFGVSHSVRLPLKGSLVTTSGQPGYDVQTGKLVTTSIRDEISACFDCVEAALKAAGVENGLAGVHKMTVFLLDILHDSLVLEVWKTRLPDHHPTWIAIGVASLAVPGMHVEMMADALILED